MEKRCKLSTAAMHQRLSAARSASRTTAGCGLWPCVPGVAVADELVPKQFLPAPVVTDDAEDATETDGWPLESFLELGSLPSAVPCARLHARQVVWEWGFVDICDTAELLVSELATNALKATRAVHPDLPIRLWLLSDKTRLLVLVWDGNGRAPVRRELSQDAESGRGLQLVEALSSHWGWYVYPGVGGKVVWCELAVDGM